MYTPASFVESDTATLHDFIDGHGFATVVSLHGSEPFASHLPLLLDRSAGPHGTLVGHMARANPQWETAADRLVLAIFHGPHAYISPSWYEDRNVVPTWNYVAVHATGSFRVVDNVDRLREIVRKTVEFYEGPREQPWSIESPDQEFLDRLLQAIVGFEIHIERLEGKWKLSQNHSAERQAKVIQRLRESNRPDEQQVAHLMTARTG
jgi:transcriptional regulator